MREKRLYEIDELLFFAMDEKGSNVHLSDKGLDELSPGDPEAFVVPDLSEVIGEIQESEELSVDQKRERIGELEAEYADKSQRIHVIHQLLKAHTLFHKDERYIIGEDGSIVIVDEFTGRQMPGRRWSDGLHQAVEAKEGVEIKGETQTLATITIQNYFRMYDKLAGMTGTAETEENEFHQIYGLDVGVIPTNRPIARDDRDDLIFRTKREKYNAIMDEIERLNRMELPVLVGTTNVEVSETISRMLKRRGIGHNVLNAKQHKRESEIVTEAGQPGTVTIATNMAGRGTDIKLGGGVTDARTVGWAKERDLDLDTLIPVDPTRHQDFSDKPDDYLIEDGGLHILGSERHESRRIDRQLRGRAGRQGDPGATQFFLSLEDDLMRLFGGMERIANAMEKMGAEEGEVITHPLVTRSIGRAQKRVEGNNFEARKRLLDYDDVMNQQREVIYDLRLFALEGGEDLKGELFEMVRHTMEAAFEDYLPEGSLEEGIDIGGVEAALAPGSAHRAASGRKRGRPGGDRSRGGSGHGGGCGARIVRPKARELWWASGPGNELRDALHDRQQVAGPPLRPGPSEGIHRFPWVGPEGPARRVQEGGLRHVRWPHGRPPSERDAAVLPDSDPHGTRDEGEGAAAVVLLGAV